MSLNPNPVVHKVEREQERDYTDDEYDDNSPEDFDIHEIFDLIRDINDPEHGDLTLEELNVVQRHLIAFEPGSNSIDITFTPTIPHCSMATLIGLCLRVKLVRSLPARFKVSVRITPGTHATEHQINKQLNDKERVAAALENPSLAEVVNKCLINSVQLHRPLGQTV
eukprot:c1819_g1_i1.p1 GENE.c1819_g1_i1~~c1819_g1_i1.p1  ORF type:complete len:167 (+),score=18.35 c1819_g1_i1:44-544(+)